MEKFKLLLSSVTAMLVAACTVEEDVTICHFPDSDSDDYEVIDVSSEDLEEHILDHGDLCFSEADDACYEPDFDGWENGGPFCPS